MTAFSEDGGASLSERLEALKGLNGEELRQRIEQTKAKERAAAEDTAAKEVSRQQAISDGLHKAKAAFASGNYQDAERLFNEVLIENPDNRIEIICNRAACALKLGNYSDALCDAAEATSMDPTYLKAQYRLALAHQGLGNTDRAMKACRAGLALKPDAAQLLKLLAELQQAAPPAAPEQPREPTVTTPLLPQGCPTPPPACPSAKVEVGGGIVIDEAKAAKSLQDLAEARARNRIDRVDADGVPPTGSRAAATHAWPSRSTPTSEAGGTLV